MKLMFKNVLKGLGKRKTQLFGIILLVLLSSCAYVASTAATFRYYENYDSYLEEQKVESFAVYFGIDLASDVFADDENTTRAEKIADVCNIAGIDDTVCIADINPETGESKNTYKALEELIVREIVKDHTKGIPIYENYNIPYMKEKITSVNWDDATIVHSMNKVFDIKGVEADGSKNKDKDKYYHIEKISDKINVPYVSSGRLPEKAGEITLFPGYMEANKISIGDMYTIEYPIFDDNNMPLGIEKKEYKVVGSAYMPAFPMGINSMAIMLDNNRDTGIYMVDEDFADIGTEDHYRSINLYSVAVDGNTAFSNSEYNSLSEEISDAKVGNIASQRHFMLQQASTEVNTNRIFGLAFSMFILGISIVVIALIMKKRIDNDAKQIGVLKSLGYKNSEIAAGYLAFPIVSSLIGVILGFFLGQLGSLYFQGQYEAMMTFPGGDNLFNLEIVIFGVLLPFLLIVVVSFIVVLYLLRVRVMDLLKPSNKHGVAPEVPKLKNIFGLPLFLIKMVIYIIKAIFIEIQKLLLKLLRPFKFKTRFKYSLALRSVGRLFALFLIVFSASMLMVFTLFGSGMVNNLLDDTFDAVKFDYQKIYFEYKDNAKENNEIDRILTSGGNLVSVNGVAIDKYIEDNNLLVSSEHFEEYSLLGVDTDMKLQELLDNNEKNITKELEAENKIIITSLIANKYGMNIGDKLEFEFIGTIKTLEVSGISIDSFQETTYIQRSQLIDIMYADGKGIIPMLELQNYTEAMENCETDCGAITIDDYRYDKDNLYNVELGKGEAVESPDAFIFSLADMEAEFEEAMQLMQTTLYVLVVVAGLISLIAIAIISGFTIEDNFKNISLLKVMGYKGKEIFNMTILVYMPIILGAYIIAAPMTYLMLKLITMSLTSTLGFELPLRISITDAILGFVVIFIAYLISVFISTRSLKKITLQEALKEE